VGLIGLLNPVTGVLLGVIFGGENFTVIQVAGIVLIFAAIYLAQRDSVHGRRSEEFALTK
jgi:probable blue pigment (indigoidine) exporter